MTGETTNGTAGIRAAEGGSVDIVVSLLYRSVIAMDANATLRR